MSRPQIKITLIDRKGPHGCHRGHKIGDSYDFDNEPGTVVFCCPDVDTINVFRIEVVQPEQDKN